MLWCFNMLTRIIHIHRSVFTLSCEQDEMVIRGVLIRCAASLLLALNIEKVNIALDTASKYIELICVIMLLVRCQTL